MSVTGEVQASVLVVEDNPDLNMPICEILEYYGLAIRSARNGVEGLEAMRDEKPDIVLCDIMMPAMDGYTLLKHTRADRELRSLPFIFLTARTSAEDQQRAKDIGVEDYLTKPVDESHLITAIENALRRRALMEEEMRSRMDTLRGEIVGLLQHEFRTPLVFVLGYAEYLLDTGEETLNLDDLRTAATAILEGGRRLERLIETFLLLAELQNHQVNEDVTSTIPASELWQNVWQMFDDDLVKHRGSNLPSCLPMNPPS
jgi:CheY-like chemotaxis protein